MYLKVDTNHSRRFLNLSIAIEVLRGIEEWAPAGLWITEIEPIKGDIKAFTKE